MVGRRVGGTVPHDDCGAMGEGGLLRLLGLRIPRLGLTVLVCLVKGILPGPTL